MCYCYLVYHKKKKEKKKRMVGVHHGLFLQLKFWSINSPRSSSNLQFGCIQHLGQAWIRWQKFQSSAQTGLNRVGPKLSACSFLVRLRPPGLNLSIYRPRQAKYEPAFLKFGQSWIRLSPVGYEPWTPQPPIEEAHYFLPFRACLFSIKYIWIEYIWILY